MLKIVWALRMGTGRAFHKDAPVKSRIRNGVISGMGCQVRVRCMRRVWCAVVGEGWVATGSTIGVAWVNGHHPDFLSTWICQLKQLSDTTTDLMENKKARAKKTFEDTLNILIATLGKMGKYCRHFRYDTEGKTTVTLIITYMSYSCCKICIAVTSCKVVPNFTTVR